MEKWLQMVANRLRLSAFRNSARVSARPGHMGPHLLSLAMIAAVLPRSLGFGATTACVDDDAAVTLHATELGVEVTTCAEVRPWVG